MQIARLSQLSLCGIGVIDQVPVDIMLQDKARGVEPVTGG